MLDLATRTDALTEPPATRRVPLDGATALHTPDRRDFTFGNLLLLDAPPTPEDLPRWLAAWQGELGGIEGIARVALQWESDAPPTPALQAAAQEAGLELETSDVLVLGDRTDLPRHPDARPLDQAGHWEAVARLIGSTEEEVGFFRWRLAAHRELIDEGRGEWWGVIPDDTPLAAAGIFWGDGLVRFQEVVTSAGHRRQGLAGGLLQRMLDAHAHRGRVVIVAERAGDGARLYRRLGFAPVGFQVALLGRESAA